MKKAVFLVLISIFAVNLMAGPPNIELVKGENRIDVVIAGKPFTSYLYGSNLTKPLLVPVRTPSGIEVSRRSAMLCRMANIAMRVARRLKFDAVSERFIDDAEANTYLTRQYRKGYELPTL